MLLGRIDPGASREGAILLRLGRDVSASGIFAVGMGIDSLPSYLCLFLDMRGRGMSMRRKFWDRVFRELVLCWEVFPATVSILRCSSDRGIMI